MKPTLMIVALLASASFAVAEEQWPRFRGPDGSGHTDPTNLPVRWSADDVAWRTELDGAGHSSACIWGDRIFVTAARKDGQDRVARAVIALDRSDGRVLWHGRPSSPEMEPRLLSALAGE